MVVSGANHVPDVNNIMGGMENTAGVRLHNHRRKLRQRFDLVRKLGQGTYGKVQLGINKETGQEVAIKTIKKAKIETEADLIRIRREIQIMSSVRHPNIIHIYEVFENKEKMVLVMEYAAGGELYDYLSERKVLSETEARRIFRQVASAVYYCHKHKICHRDLKLENILLDEAGSAKIADFGLSNVFDERRLLTTFCGSPLYASPEIVRGTPYHGPEVDCWSLGVLLYTLVYGAMPFDGSNFKRLVKQISSGDYYEPKKPSCASPLIRHMLCVEPSKRATVEDICSHWWVNEGYSESCLEVAEELANQTPVRLDLLLSLLPPPTSSDAVVVGKLDTSVSSAPATNDIEGDSMNEYYSAHSNEVTKNVDKEDNLAGKKSKKKKERDKEKEGSKRKRDISNTDVTNTSKKQETIPSVDSVAVANDKEVALDKVPATDDSGIQTSEGKKEALLTTSSSLKTGDVKEDVSNSEDAMEVDEGVSTSNSWTAANFDPNFTDRTVARNDEQEYPLSPEPSDLLQNNSSSRFLESALNSKNGGSITNESVEPSIVKESSQGTSALIESQSRSKCSFSEPGADEKEPAKESVTVKTEDHSFSEIFHKQEEDLPELQQKVAENLEEQLSKSSETVVPGTAETKVSGTSPQKQLQEQVLRGRSESSATCAAKSSRQSESRHSKILRQAELFNSLSNFRAEPKNTMTLERPKKVSDARRAYENKPDNKPMVVPALKVSDAKRAFEIAAATAKSTSTSHGSLPRRTLIQTPSSGSSSGKEQQRRSNSSSNHSQRSSVTSEDNDKIIGAFSSGEKVVVGGLGVKLGAVGRVSEIGVKVKTEEDTTTSHEAESKPARIESPPIADNTSCLAVKKKIVADKSSATQIMQRPNSTTPPLNTKAVSDKVSVLNAELVPAISAANNAATKEEAKIKKLKPMSKLSTSNAGSKEQNKEIEVILDTGDLEPKLASMLVSGSTSLHGKNEASTVQPIANKNTPVTKSHVTTPSPVTGIKPGLKSPPNGLASLLGTKNQEQREKFERGKGEHDIEDTITGSENSFLRSLRSPLRESEDHKQQTARQTENAEITITLRSPEPVNDHRNENADLHKRKTITSPSSITHMCHRAVESPENRIEQKLIDTKPPEKPIQRTEVSFPVSKSVFPTSIQQQTSSRERIIPIQVEGRDSLENAATSKPSLSTLSSVSSNASTLTRVSSPPPNKPFIRSQGSSRQSSVQSPTPDTDSLRFREPIRKSPREFIIPIAIEGGGFVTPKDVTESSLTPNTDLSERYRPGRSDRTKRFGGLFKDLPSESEDSNKSGFSSPFNTLQRLSSFGKGCNEPRNEEPAKHTEIVRSGSGSSGDDDDDDDDTFQILTAESLFSTLLSRVRQLTRRSNRENADPFVVFRGSRFASPAPSNNTNRSVDPCSQPPSNTEPRYSVEISDNRDLASPSCSSPTNSSTHYNFRNSIGSDIGSAAGSGPGTKGFWSTLYSRASSVASDSGSRRYSTLDPSRFGNRDREEQLSSNFANAPWRHRSASRDHSDNESVYSNSSGAILPRVRTSLPAQPSARVTLSLHVPAPQANGCHSNPVPQRTVQPHYVTTRTSYIEPYSPL